MIGSSPEHEWRVYLGVRSSSATPDEVTRRMGLSPDRSSSAADRRWRYLWELESGLRPDAELDEHLEALARRCGGMVDQIADLVQFPDTRVTIEAVLRFSVSPGDGSTPGIWLPPTVVRFAASCGVGIDIDIYLTAAR